MNWGFNAAFAEAIRTNSVLYASVSPACVILETIYCTHTLACPVIAIRHEAMLVALKVI